MKINKDKLIKFVKTDTEKWNVYFLFNKGKLIYIGCTNNIIRRLQTHANWYDPFMSANRKGFIAKKEFDSYRFFELGDKKKALKVENRLIKRFRPKYNDYRNYYWKRTSRKVKSDKGIYMYRFGFTERYYYRHIVIWSPVKKNKKSWKGYNAGGF